MFCRFTGGFRDMKTGVKYVVQNIAITLDVGFYVFEFFSQALNLPSQQRSAKEHSARDHPYMSS